MHMRVLDGLLPRHLKRWRGLAPPASRIVAAAFAAVALCAAARAESPVFEVTGMTFVASRESDNEVVVRAEHAVFDPDTRTAKLDQVHAQVNKSEGGVSFEMSCDHAELDVDTSDFVAEGNVRGTTADGRRFSGNQVSYDNDKGRLFTATPVLIEEASGIFFRGGGFR